MILECRNDVRVTHGDYEYLFESTEDFGYVYEVPDEVGKAAIATGQCREIVVDEEHPYKGPTPEIPSRSRVVPA